MHRGDGQDATGANAATSRERIRRLPGPLGCIPAESLSFAFLPLALRSLILRIDLLPRRRLLLLGRLRTRGRHPRGGISAREIFPVVVVVVVAAVVVVVAGELVRRRLHHLVEPAAKRLERFQRVSPGLVVARPGSLARSLRRGIQRRRRLGFIGSIPGRATRRAIEPQLGRPLVRLDGDEHGELTRAFDALARQLCRVDPLPRLSPRVVPHLPRLSLHHPFVRRRRRGPSAVLLTRMRRLIGWRRIRRRRGRLRGWRRLFRGRSLMLVEDEREGVGVGEGGARHRPDPRHDVNAGWKALLKGQVVRPFARGGSVRLVVVRHDRSLDAPPVRDEERDVARRRLGDVLELGEQRIALRGPGKCFLGDLSATGGGSDGRAGQSGAGFTGGADELIRAGGISGAPRAARACPARGSVAASASRRPHRRRCDPTGPSRGTPPVAEAPAGPPPPRSPSRSRVQQCFGLRRDHPGWRHDF